MCCVSFPLVGRCWSHFTIWFNQDSSFISSLPTLGQCIIDSLGYMWQKPNNLVYSKRAFIKRILTYLMGSKEDVTLSPQPLEDPGISFTKGSSIPLSLTWLSSQKALVLNSSLEKNPNHPTSVSLDLGKENLCPRLHASGDLHITNPWKKLTC